MAKPSYSALPAAAIKAYHPKTERGRAPVMKHSHCLFLLFLVSILVASSAVTVSPNKAAAREKAWKARAPVQLADEAFLARLCDDREQQRRRGRPPRILPLCTQLHARRQAGAHQYQHLPMPPPSRNDEQIDPRYGVFKRLVPSGPNRLHN